MKAFLKDIERTIDEHGLIDRNRPVLVALSGGADSVCLLRVLVALRYHVVALHCNFHLRGEESDRDERFVGSLCALLGVELQVRHFDTTAYSREHHVSIEMAARELRYAWFEEMRLAVGAGCVAVAHHQDDVAETVLLNLVRGTGIAGLCGMAYVNGHIVRPLLGVSCQSILDYLSVIGQDYVTDSTNLETDCKRNVIRLDVMPLLRELNPQASRTIAEMASRLSETNSIYRSSVDEAVGRVCADGTISVQRLMSEVAPHAVLFECLREYGFASSVVDDMFLSIGRGQSGKVFASDSHEALIDRDAVVIRSIDEVSADVPSFESIVDMQVYDYTPDFIIERDRTVATLDADRLVFPLTLRRAAEGDRFIPFGMHGSKLLSDYMTDRKFSLFRKSNQLVVVDAEGTICWVVGERSDNRFRVDDDTQRVCILRTKG